MRVNKVLQHLWKLRVELNREGNDSMPMVGITLNRPVYRDLLYFVNQKSQESRSYHLNIEFPSHDKPLRIFGIEIKEDG